MKNKIDPNLTFDPECCPKEEVKCVFTQPSCGELAKGEYLAYLADEACKPEKEVKYSPFEYDPDKVYMILYTPRNINNKES